MYAMIYCLCQPFAISLEHFIEDGLGSSAVALVLEERGRYIRVLFYLAEFIWLHVNKEKILT